MCPGQSIVDRLVAKHGVEGTSIRCLPISVALSSACSGSGIFELAARALFEEFDRRDPEGPAREAS